MTYLKEHFNVQNVPVSLQVAEQGSPPTRSSIVQCRGGVKIIYGVGLIILVAVISTFAVFSSNSGWTNNKVARGTVQEVSFRRPLSNIPVHLYAPKRDQTLTNKTSKSASRISKEILPKISNINLKKSQDIEVKNDTDLCITPACLTAAKQLSEAMNYSVNPCDDFYQFACGGWMDNHPFPENGRVGVYDDVVHLVNLRIMAIFESEANPGDPLPLHMTRTMYSTCMDTNSTESLGVSSLIESLDKQGGWPMILDSWHPSHFNLHTAIINLRDINVYPLVAVGVDKNLHNTTENIIYLNAGTVPLGVSLMANPSPNILKAYKAFMNAAAKYLRDQLEYAVTDEEILQQVEDVVQFESDFSKMVIEAAGQATDHAWLTDVNEIQEYADTETPGMFNWLSFFKQTFARSEVIITSEEPILSFNGPFWSNLSTFINETEPRTLANSIGWWWIYELAQETTAYLRETELEFISSIGGNTVNRTSHCMMQTLANLAFAVSRDYVTRHFSPAAKEEASQLVEDVKVGFESLLDENTWMKPDDLVVAKDKLDAIEAFVAYPDWILDDDELTLAYGGLELTSNEHYKNLLEIGRWFDFHRLQSLREDPVRSFALPPAIVNAFYKAEDNAITITAAILENPYFEHDSLAALNYGGIGFFMGHEMTHGFDSIGRLYDKDGNLVEWWSNETIRAYNERAMCFVDQYNHFYPPEVIHVGLNVSVNGYRTLPENIADNGGIREAFRAYKQYVDRHGEEPRLPGLEDYTPEQIFYMGFAYTWCVHSSATVILEQLALDAHSPGRFRVLGPLSNDEDFSRVWNCPAGSPMNRGEDRCVLW
ncbi:neprilysin-1-like isoform X1 [Palaemon carinicauda]|uniref:neprilysin-1-like isoform X1 n=1 Tax=Palaemon carinicauda TaxID=392227 RepID=UPI0035B66D18